MRFRGLVVLVAGLAFLAWSGPAMAEQTFTDPTGDQQGTAPDVTTVVVNNEADGQISFGISVLNHQTFSIPANARGKRLTCRITVTVQGVSRTYTQSFTVV